MSDTIKTRLHAQCLAQIEAKTSSLEKAIKDAQQAATDDTKSSAGDKFETSREMMKLEIDKNSQQLSRAIDMLQYLQQIDPHKTTEHVSHGSLVITNEGRYFFSVSLGKVILEDQAYFALSMTSPIGKALRDKKAGDEVSFMGRSIHIDRIL